MSLKHTETTYNLVIEHVIKEITDDPQMNSISTEAIEYLGRTWRAKLQDTGVYIPHTPHYPTQHTMSPFPIQPMPANYPAMSVTSTTEAQYRMMQQMQIPFHAFPDYMGDRSTWMQSQIYNQNMGRFANPQHLGNIQFNAKATLSSGGQPNMQQPLVQQPVMDHMQANSQYAATMKDKAQLNNNMEAAKNSIYIKSEPTREEEEQQTSKVPVKVATNGTDQGLIDVSTPKRNMNNDLATNSTKEKDKNFRNPMYEEEKKDNVFQSDEEREEEDAEEAKEEDDDDARLFDYDIDNKPDIQPKVEHVPPIQQGNTAQQPAVNLKLTDLDPYDPQERPLDSEDDDPESDKQPETTDILIAFHEKVHRHGTKWKVILKQGIMNAKGKEYLLSQITGDFDFM